MTKQPYKKKIQRIAQKMHISAETHIRTQRNSIKTQTESHNIYTKTCKAEETKQNRTSWCNIMRKKNGQRWH